MNLQRRSSKDVRGDSVSEWEKRLEKPSVPLMAKGPPGPPKIVEIEEKYSAIEGEIVLFDSVGDVYGVGEVVKVATVVDDVDFVVMLLMFFLMLLILLLILLKMKIMLLMLSLLL